MIALGSSLKKNLQVICLDGDGSLLMHMGSLRTAGIYANRNFKHILLNNNAHESVGGQKTFAHGINFNKLTKSLGYKNFYQILNENDSKKKLKVFLNSTGPSFLEIKISKENMKILPRPKKLANIKKRFMKI